MSPTPQLKFRNIPTTLGGLRFASRAEAKRYGELLLMQRAGIITNIVCQPRFPLSVNGVIIGAYIGDFSYNRDNALVVEDVKSAATRTATYRLKRKLLSAIYGIEIVEIDASQPRCQPVNRKRISRV